MSRWRTRHWGLYIVSNLTLHVRLCHLTLDNGVNRARLLAETAVDALCHVNVVARCPPAAVHALLGLDCDGLRRADGLAELAGNAALLAGGVPSQGVLATEAGGNGALLEGVEDGVSGPWSEPAFPASCMYRRTPIEHLRRPEKLLQRNIHAAEHLHEQEVLAGLVQRRLALIPLLLAR